MKLHGFFYFCTFTLCSCTAKVVDSPEPVSTASIPNPEQITVDLGLGLACSEDLECESFYCFIANEEDLGVCTLSCDEEERCPSEYVCSETTEGQLCLAEENTCNSNLCNEDDDCSAPECVEENQGGEMPAGEMPAGEQSLVCGNGVIDPNEECDGGNGCTSDCRLIQAESFCGNGIIEMDEECDGSGDCDPNCMSYDGGDGPDIITGDDRDNMLRGRGGNDIIRGGGGNDELIGGEGDDDLDGGDDDDELKGREGNDILRGSGGNDSLMGGPGDDLLKGGQGNDTVMGGEGNDELRGGIGTDHLYGNAGDDTYAYSPGNEIMHIYPNGGGNDRLLCRQGASIINSRNSNGDLRLNTTSGGEIIIHDQTNSGSTIDLFDCPGYDDD